MPVFETLASSGSKTMTLTLPHAAGDDRRNGDTLPLRQRATPARTTYKIRYSGKTGTYSPTPQKGKIERKFKWSLFLMFLFIIMLAFGYHSLKKHFENQGPVLINGLSEKQWAQKEENLKQRHIQEMKTAEENYKTELSTALEKLREELTSSLEEDKRQKEEQINQLTEKEAEKENRINQLNAEKEEKVQKINELTESLEKLKSEKTPNTATGSEEQEKRIQELQAEVDQVREELHRTVQNEHNKKEEEIAQLNEKAYNDKLKMQSNIQIVSKRAAIEKYGPGPHRVEIQLWFDPNSNVGQEAGPDKIMIEMAPIDLMPHTVYWFLERVHNKLYDGTSFHTNLPHIIQGGPYYDEDKQQGRSYYDDFADLGLARIMFQEYSDKFPHVEYTLGYAGRPGGADFYISLKDNTINHGPGGQNRGQPTEADPCFAKVVGGIDTIERMHRGDVDNRMIFQNRVIIQHMKIVGNNGEEGQQ